MRANTQIEAATGRRSYTCDLSAIVDRERPRKNQTGITGTNEFVQIENRTVLP
jgi:hypothetical protein